MTNAALSSIKAVYFVGIRVIPYTDSLYCAGYLPCLYNVTQTHIAPLLRRFTSLRDCANKRCEPYGSQQQLTFGTSTFPHRVAFCPPPSLPSLFPIMCVFIPPSLTRHTTDVAPLVWAI